MEERHNNGHNYADETHRRLCERMEKTRRLEDLMERLATTMDVDRREPAMRS